MASAIMCLRLGAFDVTLWLCRARKKKPALSGNSNEDFKALHAVLSFTKIPPVLWIVLFFFCLLLHNVAQQNFPAHDCCCAYKVLLHITGMLTDNWHLQHYLYFCLGSRASSFLFIPTVSPLEMKLWNVKQQRQRQKFHSTLRKRSVNRTKGNKMKISYPYH